MTLPPSPKTAEPLQPGACADRLLITLSGRSVLTQWLVHRDRFSGYARAAFLDRTDGRSAGAFVSGRALRRDKTGVLDHVSPLCRLRLYRQGRLCFFSGQIESVPSVSLLWDLSFAPPDHDGGPVLSFAGGRIFLNGDEYLVPEGSSLFAVQSIALSRGFAAFAAGSSHVPGTIRFAGACPDGRIIFIGSGKHKEVPCGVPVFGENAVNIPLSDDFMTLRAIPEQERLIMPLRHGLLLRTAPAAFSGFLASSFDHLPGFLSSVI